MLVVGRTNVGPRQNKCWTHGRQNVGSLADKNMAETFRQLCQMSLTINKNEIAFLRGDRGINVIQKGNLKDY